MRMFNLLTFSLAVMLLGAYNPMKVPGDGGPGNVFVPASISALDIPVSQFDDRFGNMVAEVPCTVPYTFINGTVAQAGQVNANFQALTNCLSTIYASDIIPGSAAQATFGGTLQYTFPAGVAVAGGQSNGLTTTSGTLWLVSAGNVTGAYALNLSAANCGSTGLLQAQKNATTEFSVSCAGDVIANSGNYMTSGGSVFLCPGTAACGANSQFKVDTTGAMTAQGPLFGSLAGGPSPIPSASAPAPAGLCYKSNGNPCASTFHEISDQTTTAALPTCTPLTGSLCGGATAINFPFAFTDALYQCFGDGLTAGVLPVFVNTNTLQASFQVINATGSAIFGPQTIYWDCRGK